MNKLHFNLTHVELAGECVRGVRFTVKHQRKDYCLFWVPGAQERIFRIFNDGYGFIIVGEYRVEELMSDDCELRDKLREYWQSKEVQRSLWFWRVCDAVTDPLPTN